MEMGVWWEATTGCDASQVTGVASGRKRDGAGMLELGCFSTVEEIKVGGVKMDRPP